MLVRQGCIISPWLFNVYMDKMKMEMGRSFLQDGRDWRLLRLLYADNLVLCGKDLRVTMGRFAEVCRRRRLKVIAGKSNVMVLNGEEILECEVHVDGIRSEHVSEF